MKLYVQFKVINYRPYPPGAGPGCGVVGAGHSATLVAVEQTRNTRDDSERSARLSPARPS